MNNEFNRINENIISFNNNDTTENKNNNYHSYSEKKNFNDFQIDYKHYSELCEKRIKQLCPNQTFPITMEDLSKNNCLTSMEVKYQLKETQIMKLENELQDLRNKCSLLKEQNKQMIESREKIFKTLKEQKDFLIFPPPDRIPCEKLYEGYSKLYEAFNKISNDKQVAIVSLQNEILINDQQRNYIEILKQTLESNLIKNGIKSQIEIYNKIQKKKNSEECVKNLDNMCECYEELFNVVGLNQKIEDLYKQNNALEIENNKLKSDINDLKNRNNVFREQINDSLKIGIKELEQAKYKIKDLEGQKKDLINENNILKSNIDQLKNELEQEKLKSQKINEQLMAENTTLKNSLNALSEKNKKYASIENLNLDAIKGDIIKSKEELELLSKKLCYKCDRICFNLVFKATIDSDQAEAFHYKCDPLEKSLILIESTKGARFGGFTSCSWGGDKEEKYDDSAFVFSLDKLKIYDILPGEKAIACYPKFGPVFLGCQIKIYDNFFTKGGSTYFKGINYDTDENYELSGGEQKYGVKELEVYEIILG